MGKFIRKAKPTSDVDVMDLSLGVRTRAKTLALQRQGKLHASPPPPPPPSSQSASAAGGGGGGYLQLRSRRLEKPPIVVHDSKRQKHAHNSKHGQAQNQNANAGPNSKVGSRLRVDPADSGSGQQNESNRQEIQENNSNVKDNNKSKDLGIEACFGENVLDFEGRERSTRESTPCSLIRDPETIRTPGSTTKPTCSTETNRRIENSMHRHIPTAHEIDAFFAKAEEEQQTQFIKKYNFDPVNDKPLPGRYEWEKLDH